MENFKGTKGEVKKVSHYNKEFLQETFLICTREKDAFAEVYTGSKKPDNSKLFKQAEADADLIVDAFNIANTHDLLPSQLLEQRNKLLEFAMEMVKRYPNSPWIYEQAQKAIDKALK